MSARVFTCAEAKKIDLVDYLKELGYQPQKIRSHDYWYCSPLREERTASFKINRRFNVWFDHGLGKGGNIVDFGVLYHRCSIKELLARLNQKTDQFFSFHQPLAHAEQNESAHESNKIRIVAIRELQSPRLIAYVSQRKIPVALAGKYCKEVDFRLHDKQYTAIGFRNNAGGYELRNEYFKGSSAPKDITVIGENFGRNMAVFEGFFSFLSYQAILEKEQQNVLQLPKLQTNYLVLNSLSFFEKSRPLMEKHSAVHLYLDRDKAGIKATLNSMLLGKQYHDLSHQYKQYKDLNEYLMHADDAVKQQQRKGRRL